MFISSAIGARMMLTPFRHRPENEPILMVIGYGKGRVFHTTLGHDTGSMSGLGSKSRSSAGPNGRRQEK
jgi:hypothetical protein